MAGDRGRAHPSIYEAMRPPWRGCIESSLSILRTTPSKYTTFYFRQFFDSIIVKREFTIVRKVEDSISLYFSCFPKSSHRSSSSCLVLIQYLVTHGEADPEARVIYPSRKHLFRTYNYTKPRAVIILQCPQHTPLKIHDILELLITAVRLHRVICKQASIPVASVQFRHQRLISILSVSRLALRHLHPRASTF